MIKKGSKRRVFSVEEEKPEEKPAKKLDMLEEVEIMPLSDFRITHNEYDIIIKEGVSVPIPRLFLQNMVAEKVIDKIPG